MLGDPITIRLSLEKQKIYEAEASSKALSLNKYLRLKLEENEIISDKITNLSALIEQLSLNSGGVGTGAHNISGNQSQSPQPPELMHSILLEMLLILRQSSQVNRVDFAQAELKRMGLQVWQGEG